MVGAVRGAIGNNDHLYAGMKHFGLADHLPDGSLLVQNRNDDGDDGFRFRG
ncbi:hypothetical protein D3C76_1489230 [compost metagenome]